MRLTRRNFFQGAAAGLLGPPLNPLQSLAAEAKRVRITDIDLFTVDVPVTPAEDAAGVLHRYEVTKLITDAGVTGYSFSYRWHANAGPSPRARRPAIRDAIVGKELFNVDGQLRDGLWRWGTVEHAVWDAIGKIAGQPVYKLLGGHEERVNAYLTCVWPGPADQQQVPFSYRIKT